MSGVVDYAAAWTELGAWMAQEPNRGRQAVLVKMAQLAAAHTVEEDELERALRLVAPRMQDLLLNRVPQLTALLTHPQDPQVGEGSAPGERPEAVPQSMAAV